MATEFWAEFGSDAAITITPAGDGRLELYLDGEKLFDRKAEGGRYPGLDKLRELKKIARQKVEALAVR